MCKLTKTKGDGRSSKRQKISSSSVSFGAPTKEWPAYPEPNDDRCILKGLLSGYDKHIWNALAHVNPQLFHDDAPMQVLLRPALEIIGLGWIGTNSTPARVSASYICRKAKEFYEGNKKGQWRVPDIPQRLRLKMYNITVRTFNYKSI